MMHAKFLRLLNHASEALFTGNVDHATRYFSYPHPLFLKDELLVFGSPETMFEVMQLYYEEARAAGVVRKVPRIVALGLPVRGTYSVWVEWDLLDADGNCVRTSQVRYVISDNPHAIYPTVELSDYTVTAFPELVDTLPTMSAG